MTGRTRDIVLAALLAAVALVTSWHNGGRVGEALDVRGPSPGGYDDIWFDADTRDLHRRFTFDNYQQTHTARHPLIALIGRLPMRIFLRAFPGADRVTVVRGAIAGLAGVWAALLFVTLRCVGCRPLDAFVFAAIGISSAAALFWFTVPETFALGSVTILPAVAMIGIAERRRVPEWAAMMVAAGTLSVTSTNGMCGAIATWLSQPHRRFLQLMANAVCIVLVLWGVQRFIYPSSSFPYLYDRSYRGFFFSADMHTPAAPLAAFFLHGIVMPTVAVIQRATQNNYPVLSVQRAGVAAMTLTRAIASAAWIALLAGGICSAAAGYVPARVRAMLLWSIAGQLMLHLVFGDETFLFAMHFTPLLIVAAAFGTAAPWRRPMLALAIVLLVTMTVNNLSQLASSIEQARQITARIGS